MLTLANKIRSPADDVCNPTNNYVLSLSSAASLGNEVKYYGSFTYNGYWQ
jgi:hypothetical protein